MSCAGTWFSCQRLVRPIGSDGLLRLRARRSMNGWTTSMVPSPAISVVVACYNEQEMLPELHRRVSAVCASLGQSYEIVLVDDGSKDATWSLIQQAAAADS